MKGAVKNSGPMPSGSPGAYVVDGKNQPVPWAAKSLSLLTASRPHCRLSGSRSNSGLPNDFQTNVGPRDACVKKNQGDGAQHTIGNRDFLGGSLPFCRKDG